MRRDGTLVGVIHVDWLELHPQREQEVHMLELTAERCAASILNAQLYAKVMEAHAFNESLLQTIPFGIHIVDEPGRILFMNKAMRTRVGEDAIGKPYWEVYMDDRQQRGDCPLRIPVEIGRTELVESLGVLGGRVFQISRTGMRYGQGKAVLEIFRDITEHRQLEAQLRQSQKMEAIGQLAGGVAHDFNNLLSVIRGHTDLLLMKGDQFPADAKDGLKQIAAAADRAANLTRQLLAFGRKQVMQSQPLSLNEVITNLTRMLDRIIGEDIRLQCNFTVRLPLVRADIGMMEQVLVNLVVNARDSMPQGGQLIIATGKVRLEEDYVRLHPEARAGEFVCLNVTDAGTGIPEKHLPHIFEPFFTIKELGKGTGLGLATVDGIVKQHEGWIEVSSQEGEGSTFKIFLPAIEAPAPADAVETPDVTPRGGAETILLVEDDQAVRSLTRRVLENFGYNVREAGSGGEALRLWSANAAKIDLLLTDIVLPGGFTGRELAEQMRAQRPALKVIFTSGYSRDMAGKDTDFIRRNRSHYLQKPCPPTTLIRIVRQCLDEK